MSTDLITKDRSDEGKTSPAASATAVEVNEKALLRKIDAYLLPAVGVLYLLSFLDRSNGMTVVSFTCRGRYY
jgi:hypothetical protein